MQKPSRVMNRVTPPKIHRQPTSCSTPSNNLLHPTICGTLDCHLGVIVCPSCVLQVRLTGPNPLEGVIQRSNLSTKVLPKHLRDVFQRDMVSRAGRAPAVPCCFAASDLHVHDCFIAKELCQSAGDMSLRQWSRGHLPNLTPSPPACVSRCSRLASCALRRRRGVAPVSAASTWCSPHVQMTWIRLPGRRSE
jgi:hypothetical protein